jgi:predicted metal-binding membrane protein
MMNLVAMAAVTLAITAERLAPAPRRVARVAGVAIVALGVVVIARI